MRLNRRSFIGAVAAAAVVNPARAISEQTIPSIGMGTWRTFDVGASEQARAQRAEVLRAFFDMGGRLIDSSPMYGSSQAVVGDGLARIGRADDVFSADKVWIRGGANGPAQISESARRWRIGKFNLLQVHNLVSWRAHLETLNAMKAEGRLGAVGITSYSGLRYRDMAQIMETEALDFIQLTYNIVDREAEKRLLPMAKERGVRVIANRPFREGALIDAAKRRPLPGLAAELGADNWAQFLLKFIISHSAVTAAIPATRRVDHMRENMGALNGPLPDAALRREMIAAFEAA